MAKISYLGHSTFQIETNGQTIITDPFIRPNEKAASIDFDSLKADIILVTHGHDDHTADLIDLARQTGAEIFCSFEVFNWVVSHGYDNAHPMNIGGSIDTPAGRIKMVPAIHSSSFKDGKYAGEASGFVIDNHMDRIYFAGDTALTYDMKLIGEEFDLTVAILPIGDNFTMGPRDAAIASEFLKCKKVIGMHFDTFGWIEIDHDVARLRFSERGAELIVPQVGESWEI